MPYLNVQETNSLLRLFELKHFECSRIELPHLTSEKRRSWALRIRRGHVPVLHPIGDAASDSRRVGVLLLGGMHAREWGSTDILMFLAERILEGQELPFPIGASRPFATCLPAIDLFIFPMVNPDGKHYSQTVDPDWRKNRAPTSNLQRPGVDINRNFDWLWDYRLHFRPQSLPATSDDPASDVYHGPSPFSEAESQNVRHLLDAFPNIQFLVDVHSYSGLILYPWGDDEFQSREPLMFFGNSQYDGLRGRFGDSEYREYVHPGQVALYRQLVRRMGAALRSVRGTDYELGQKALLLYRTSGTATDYAFSRHITTPRLRKINSILIEWGIESGFQPPYEAEMRPIIFEVASALVELLIFASELPQIDSVPNNLGFGQVNIGNSNTRVIRLTNSGTRPVTITSLQTHGSDFFLASPSGGHPVNLNVDDKLDVQVTFRPQQAGLAIGGLRFKARYIDGRTTDAIEVRLGGRG